MGLPVGSWFDGEPHEMDWVEPPFLAVADVVKKEISVSDDPGAGAQLGHLYVTREEAGPMSKRFFLVEDGRSALGVQLWALAECLEVGVLKQQSSGAGIFQTKRRTII